MKAHQKATPPQSNPFVEGFLESMDAPEGELSIDVMDIVLPILEKVEVDAKARKLVWDDGKRLSIDESVQRIHAQYPQFAAQQIEEQLISWLEMGYAPESYSRQQLDDLDHLTERWINGHYRRRPRT